MIERKECRKRNKEILKGGTKERKEQRMKMERGKQIASLRIPHRV
jgi:hypothetical protein